VSDLCRLSGKWTADGKFGIGYHSSGHDHLWGGWVTTDAKYVVFSTARAAVAGEIKVPNNQLVTKLQTSADGRDYLLLIQGGGNVSVYELRE
jgi:hypothetical protein